MVIALLLLLQTYAQTSIIVQVIAPNPNTVTVAAPVINEVILAAISTAPRVDFYVGGVKVGTVLYGLKQVPVLASYDTGVRYFGLLWKPKSFGKPVSITAYACASTTACTGKARLASSTILNVTVQSQ